MDRRSAGFAVLLAVIIAAPIVPALGGQHLTGAALRGPIPDPPVVGDCLGDVPSQPSAMVLSLPVFAEQTGSCGDDNVGAIVAVVPKVYFSPPTLDNGTSVAQAVDCDPLVQDYLGWSTPTDASSGNASESSALVQWHPPTTIDSGLLGPDLAQYIYGQRWVACVVYPEFGPFRGSIRGSVRDGHNAEALASCQAMPDGTALQPTSCSQPHRAETFGVVAVSDQNANLEPSCLALVHRLTGMSDVSSGGALIVGAVITSDSAQNSASTLHPAGPQEYEATCLATVAGSRLLVGTLIGLGDRRLPWN